MKTGDPILIRATVLRVTGTRGNRLDAQTADGQLIQTDVSNAMSDKVLVGVDFARPSDVTVQRKPTATAKPKTDKKSVPPAENKAVLNAPENKSANK